MSSIVWNNATGSFSAVYTSAQNGYTYAIDAAGNIYEYNSLSWSLKSGPSSNPVIYVSAGGDGSLGVVDNIGDCYVFSYGIWNNLYTPALGIAVGDSQNYIVADQMGTIVESSYGSVNYSYGPSKLSTTVGLGTAYGVDGTGTIYQKSGSSWNSISGKTLKQIDVSQTSSGSVICGVDGSGDAWILNGSVWVQMSKPAGISSIIKFVSVEMGTGKIWATFSNGQVYYGN